ncbi:MAG: AmpG family muropeptide MFS transporter [Verrucomicrobia bacterium]|nr:AmpG family muropeptide MFS transporter [Verrucomicrobiota bacterium]
MNATTPAASQPTARGAWAWIPTLYFAQGIPYVVVMTMSVIMYKRLGVSNTAIALYTSWLYLPWVIKPLWSPLVELFGTKRHWIVLMQLFVGAALACVALTIPGPAFFRVTLGIFWLLAFASATHDIAADGFYMLALDKHDQAWFVGVRSTFYRLSMIAGQGLLVMLAGALETRLGDVPLAWAITFAALAGLFLTFFAYHFLILPKPAADAAPLPSARRNPLLGFFRIFGAFFQKPDLARSLAFLLLYRFAESQLVKIASLFLLDAPAKGGLGLSTGAVGFTYGTVGVIALTLGGLLGGFVAARQGLKSWLPAMVCAINLPNLLYLYLAYAQPASLVVINACVALEQFGYGFGFAAYMIYMLYLAQGEHQTAHYALCTGFMALGMMIPGMWAGWLQEFLGYRHFFLWIMLCTIPGFVATALIRPDPSFGRKA